MSDIDDIFEEFNSPNVSEKKDIQVEVETKYELQKIENDGDHLVRYVTMQKDLVPYLSAINKISKINESNCNRIVSELSIGLIKAGELSAFAHSEFGRAKTKRKEVEGRVWVHEARKIIESSGEKVTEKSKEAVCNSHKDVIKAKNIETDLEAAIIKAESIKGSFSQALASVKNIISTAIFKTIVE